MSPLLFIGPDHGQAIGGRENLARLHRQALSENLGPHFDTFLLPCGKLSGLDALVAASTGRVNGASRAVEAQILHRIETREIKRVWLDGSNLGILARAVKRRFPHVEVLTFFHNIEPRFFWGALRQRPGVRALGVMAATYVAERNAVRFSDRLVALNGRDGAEIGRWHGL